MQSDVNEGEDFMNHDRRYLEKVSLKWYEAFMDRLYSANNSDVSSVAPEQNYSGSIH